MIFSNGYIFPLYLISSPDFQDADFRKWDNAGPFDSERLSGITSQLRGGLLAWDILSKRFPTSVLSETERSIELIIIIIICQRFVSYDIVHIPDQATLEMENLMVPVVERYRLWFY